MSRPVLRYHGGKWRLAPWVIAHFPPHRIYVEPYGGAASVLMQKARTYAEVYNDIDGEVVNVFRVLRDPAKAKDLEGLLRLTPFAREEFLEAYLPADDPIEQARRTIVKAFMGFGSNGVHTKRAKGMRTRASQWRTGTGFRANCTRTGTTPAHDWAHYHDYLQVFTARLQGVVIENRNALEVISQHATDDALIYCDPPYVLSTRADAQHDYRDEMTDAQHIALAELLHQVPGSVIISGYACPLYDELYGDWRQTCRQTRADQALPRIETLWLNPAAARGRQISMFDEVYG
jgi:DNA adenine methylase